ncbi:uncharacterized protein LOC117330629 [Pecten maximus]|uniref:uncharacterized protein LOC117330629 n=1 Tax=Pecten maximus TaxID=6579 RepID=UPI001457F090|nr:uncharacterized protein LOC117330629 [Pecten maximus]
MLAPKLDLLAAIICSGLSFVSAELCYALDGYTDVLYGTYTYKTLSAYCSSDQYCCGGIYYTSCCNYYTISYVISAGTLAGAVVGGLFGLGFLSLCIVCVICATRRNRRSGRVIMNTRKPNTAATTFTTTTFTAPPPQDVSQPGSYPIQGGYPPNPQYPQQPGGYNVGYTPEGQYLAGGNQMAPAPPAYTTVVPTNTATPPVF